MWRNMRNRCHRAHTEFLPVALYLFIFVPWLFIDPKGPVLCSVLNDVFCKAGNSYRNSFCFQSSL